MDFAFDAFSAAGEARQDMLRDAPAYPASHAQPAAPVMLPWPLKPMASARFGVRRLPDGRLCHWIQHEVLAGVTPAMLLWWFQNLEGEVDINGQRVSRYRAWHPHDHVHASYARRCADGSIGPGAAIRLREYLGANRRHMVNIVTDIERLDEGGFVHNPRHHGIGGLARMEYRFTAVGGGTLFENCLIVGGRSGWRRWITPLVLRWVFRPEQGVAWLKHNIEEVGLLERFLPGLYRRETGRQASAPATTRNTSAP